MADLYSFIIICPYSPLLSILGGVPIQGEPNSGGVPILGGSLFWGGGVPIPGGSQFWGG